MMTVDVENEKKKQQHLFNVMQIENKAGSFNLVNLYWHLYHVNLIHYNNNFKSQKIQLLLIPDANHMREWMLCYIIWKNNQV